MEEKLFIQWMQITHPNIKLSSAQLDMLETLFSFERIEYARQSGKTFIINLMVQYQKFLLGDD